MFVTSGSRSGRKRITASIGGSYTDEQAQDAVGAMAGASLVYVDATPLFTRAALTGAITAAQDSNTTVLGSFTKAELDEAISDGNALYVGDITQYTDEMARDALGAALVAGTNITITVNDGADTITLDSGIWGPVVDGSIPPVFIQNADGSLILAEYT